MHVPHEAVLLRIFLGESDRWRHQPLYEAIVFKVTLEKVKVIQYRAEGGAAGQGGETERLN